MKMISSSHLLMDGAISFMSSAPNPTVLCIPTLYYCLISIINAKRVKYFVENLKSSSQPCATVQFNQRARKMKMMTITITMTL